jgi:hypothetical protein
MIPKRIPFPAGSALMQDVDQQGIVNPTPAATVVVLTN